MTNQNEAWRKFCRWEGFLGMRGSIPLNFVPRFGALERTGRNERNALLSRCCKVPDFKPASSFADRLIDGQKSKNEAGLKSGTLQHRLNRAFRSFRPVRSSSRASACVSTRYCNFILQTLLRRSALAAVFSSAVWD